ncbi:MAG TPA: carboxypeptidase-like regulatory domain-containing protein, partial [Thermoanaerobaculia bacterium]|nr:carboxypeptidase-like regulatory domain-containing protein [Thermoanaerobaculia bacterium]
VQGILEKDGEPLQPGRLLRLVAQDSTIRASALSTPGGSFSFPFLAPGQYTLLVDGTAVHSFALGEGSAEDLGRISVP